MDKEFVFQRSFVKQEDGNENYKVFLLQKDYEYLIQRRLSSGSDDGTRGRVIL